MKISPNDALAIGMLLALLLPVFGLVWNFVILSLVSDYLRDKKVTLFKVLLASLMSTAIWFFLFVLQMSFANKIHSIRYPLATPQHTQVDLWLSMPPLILIMIASVLLIIKFVFRLTWRESLILATVAGVLLSPWTNLFYLHWFLFVLLAVGWWIVKKVILWYKKDNEKS